MNSPDVNPESERILRDVLRDERPFSAFEALFHSRVEAIEYYARAVAEQYGPGKATHECAFCAGGPADMTLQARWQTTVDFQVGRTVGLAILYFPLVATWHFFVPWLPMPIRDPGLGGRAVAFTTHHGMCRRCRRALRWRRVIGHAVSVFYGLLLVSGIAAAIVFATLSIAAAVGGFGWKPVDVKLFLPWFVVALVALVFVVIAARAAESYFMTPAPLRPIAHGPFRAPSFRFVSR